jgi:hypothetical protein
MFAYFSSSYLGKKFNMLPLWYFDFWRANCLFVTRVENVTSKMATNKQY